MTTRFQMLALTFCGMVAFCSAACDTDLTLPPPALHPGMLTDEPEPLIDIPGGHVDGRDVPDFTADDSFEQNDDPEHAADISTGKHALEGLDDDWFRFEARETGMLSVVINGTSGNLDLVLFDDDATTELDGSAGSGSHEEIEFEVTAGDYLIRVQPRGGLPENEASYTMRIEFTPWSLWGYDVNLVSIAGYGSAVLTGELSDGAIVHDMSWASDSAYCFTAPMASDFSGNQVFYALEIPQPRNSEVTITVTPDPGVDVSLYGYQIGMTDFSKPPDVDSVVQCEESHDAGPGGIEAIADPYHFRATTNEYNIFFAVVGDGITSGGFTVEVNIDPPA